MPTPFPTLPFPSLPAYGSNNSALNVALAAGLDIQSNVPVDGRSVVFDDVQRKNIRYAYEGLEVRVLGTGRKFKFVRRNHPVGLAANNDAWWEDITESVARNGYQGPWDPATAFPGTTQPVVLPGDYYIVEKAGSGDFGSGAVSLDLGDLVIFSTGTNWHRIANYSPTLPVSIAYTDVQGFDERVFYNIARGALLLYNPAQPYLKGQMVAVIEDYTSDLAAAKVEQLAVYRKAPATLGNAPLVDSQDANQTKMACSIYWAQRDTVANESLGDTSAFLLIASTNYNRQYGRLILDNTAGIGGTNAGTDDGTGKVMDIKETMRRVAALITTTGPTGGGQIWGGAPDTPDSVLGTPVV